MTIKEANRDSPFKPIDNKEPPSEGDIKRKLQMAEERRLVRKICKYTLQLYILIVYLQYLNSKSLYLQSLKSQIQEQAANELKRVQEKTQKKEEETEAKKKKLEEEIAADLEAKEQNRLQLLEEKKSKLSGRMAANVSYIFCLYFFVYLHDFV